MKLRGQHIFAAPTTFDIYFAYTSPMKKVLIVQSRAHPNVIAAEQAEYRRAISDLAESAFESTLDIGQSWNTPEKILEEYDGVIIGGSGEFDLHSNDPSDARMIPAQEILARVTPFIVSLLDRDIPTLGVCFGHQLIGEIRRGMVSSDISQKKVGSYEVQLTEAGQADRLFAHLPPVFIAQYGHRNALTQMPAGAELLAKSDNCKFSALRYGPHVYTTQFHPELTRQDVLWKLANSPEYLGIEPETLAQESPEASRIIPLFIEHVVTPRRI